MDQQFCLRWNNYLSQITNAFDSLKNEEDLVDVTLSCEGKKLKAHKMLLSACSPYFREVFKENPCQHPVIVFRNFKYVDLEAIIDFMYKGEVDVKQEHFESFLGTAELLEVKGLTESSRSNNVEDEDNNVSKMTGSGTELLPECLNPKTEVDSPQAQSASQSKKRKNSTLPEKVKPSEKKQKSAEPFPSIIPKIEEQDEEFIEDLTFDEEDTDESHSTSTDLSHMPSGRSRVDFSADFSSSSISDHQDSSQLPKGHAHLSDPGSSHELPPDIMQTQEIESAEIEAKTESAKSMKITTDQKEDKTGHNENDPVPKLLSSNTIGNIVSKNLDGETKTAPNDFKLVVDEKTENKNKLPKASNQNLEDILTSPLAKPSNSKELNFPKGLTVSLKETNQINVESNQFIEEEVLLRSEEAKTPIQEEFLTNQSQLPEMCCDVPTSPSQLVLAEPEMAEEAPQMTSDETISEVLENKEEEEPEFDYFGCETCKAEAKPFDKFKLVLSHKCPICPCACFCAHLLKEHMKIIHGWFNVQRRYKQY